MFYLIEELSLSATATRHRALAAAASDDFENGFRLGLSLLVRVVY